MDPGLKKFTIYCPFLRHYKLRPTLQHAGHCPFLQSLNVLLKVFSTISNFSKLNANNCNYIKETATSELGNRHYLNKDNHENLLLKETSIVKNEDVNAEKEKAHRAFKMLVQLNEGVKIPRQCPFLQYKEKNKKKSSEGKIDTNRFNYETFFLNKIIEKKKDHSYRTFNSVDRLAENFPYARNSKLKKIITVWCSNDYLGMSRNEVVLDAMRFIFIFITTSPLNLNIYNKCIKLQRGSPFTRRWLWRNS
jgi:hypothetical protein